MSVFLIAAAVLLAGLDWRLVMLGVAAWTAPWLFAVGLGLLVVRALLVRRKRSSGPEDEAAFHTAVAAELRSGASLRAAIGSAAPDAPALPLRTAVRYATTGVDASRVATELEGALPVTGVATGAAVRLSASSGGRAAAAFDALADRALFEKDMAREQRALTAQARLSALVVGGGPLALALLLLGTGRARTLFEHGTVGLLALGVGLGLELAGIATVAVLLRRHA